MSKQTEYTKIEKLSLFDDVDGVTQSKTVERSVIIFDNMTNWGNVGSEALVLKSSHDPLTMLENKVDESLCWKQYYRSANKLVELSDNNILFIEMNEDDKRLVLRTDKDMFDRVVNEKNNILKDKENNRLDVNSTNKKSNKALYIMSIPNGVVKVGISKNPKKRRNSIQTSCPYNVTLLASTFKCDPEKVEEKLHDKYNAYKMSGEWFDLPINETQKLINSIESDNLDEFICCD